MRIKKQLISLFLIGISFFATAQAPKRIVSLVPAISKQLYELGLEDNIVGCTSYCPGKDRPGVTIVASAIKVNIEKTLLLKPDLVLASSLTNPKTLETLKKMGVKTIWFDYPKSYANLCTQFIELGKITGKEKEAQQIVSQSDADLAEIKMNIVAVKPMKWLIQVGANPLWVSVENTFMNDYIKFAKGINAAKGVQSGAVSRESILLQNPDVIFICMSGTQAEAEKQRWISYKSLNATQSEQVFIIDPNLTNSPTPSTFIIALEKMMDMAYNM
jgi:iron complex transport system substrate-binding protein